MSNTYYKITAGTAGATATKCTEIKGDTLPTGYTAGANGGCANQPGDIATGSKESASPFYS